MSMMSIMSIGFFLYNNVHNAVDQENGCGGEEGSAGSGLNSDGGGLKELDPSQERRRCSRVRFMKQVFLGSSFPAIHCF